MIQRATIALCICATMLKAQLVLHWYSSSWSCRSTKGPFWVSNRREGSPPPLHKGFQGWVMTQCVVVLGLLCVEMCLVWSWFGLFFNFLFFWTCTSVLLLFVTAGLLVCLIFELLFWDLLFCNVESFFTNKRTKKKKALKNTKKNPHLTSPLPPHFLPPPFFWPPVSLPHTHTPTYATTPQKKPSPPPHTPQLPLFASPPVCRLSCWLTFSFSCSLGKPVNRQRALTVKQTA